MPRSEGEKADLGYDIKAALDFAMREFRGQTRQASAEQMRDAILLVDTLVDDVLEEVADFVDQYVIALIAEVNVLPDGDHPADSIYGPIDSAVRNMHKLAFLELGISDEVDVTVQKMIALIERTGRYKVDV